MVHEHLELCRMFVELRLGVPGKCHEVAGMGVGKRGNKSLVQATSPALAATRPLTTDHA